MCTEFEKLMRKKFQMSSMGDLTFFLGLQVTQKDDGIFINQDKSMIGSLMYLTSSRPDIKFAVCACARFQVTPKVLHLHAVKRIFRYLKVETGNPSLSGLYVKDGGNGYKTMLWVGIEVKTGNSKVNAAGHNLVLLGIT
ncbi:hypothetical protein Tco_0216073 [Tanacetum coccineum]